MKKRTFLKLSTALIAGAAYPPLMSCSSKQEKMVEAVKEPTMIKNWAGNLTYSTSNLHEPTTIDEIKAVIEKSEKLRALGTRHCFNTIADSTANLLSTRMLKEVGEVDKEANTITVGAGVRYGDLCKVLDAKGYALHNLASLPHISVAGACATATHGSGVNNGNLATSVSAIEFVSGSGEVVKLSRADDADTFNGAVVNLGCLGVLSKVTLNLLPTFQIAQLVYLNLPISQLEKNFEDIMSSGYSVSLFTDWQTDAINQVWVKQVANSSKIVAPIEEFYGAKPADRNVHPIIDLSAVNCTDQMGVPGPWYDRLPHFKLDFTPSSGEELQAEYFVPFDKAVDAIKAVTVLKSELKDLLMITEIRSIASDELWMSMSYQRPSVAIHFTLKQNIEGVARFLPKLEEKLAPFDPRPHWGKLFTLSPSVLQSRYGKINEFKRLIAKYDPQGKFQNEFITSNIFGTAKF
ncbi:MAG: D-arabinono-1,4-lactone oxidase [Chryseolinea sp.]